MPAPLPPQSHFQHYSHANPQDWVVFDGGVEVAGFQAASVGLVAEYIVAIDVTQFDWRGKSGEVPMKQASARLQALVQTQSPRTRMV